MPETLLALGAILGERGKVGVGWTGGEGAGLLARSCACGVSAAGGSPLLTDAPCASAGAWLGRYQEWPVTLFATQDGDSAELRLFGPDGLAFQRGEQRKIEGALLRGETGRVPAGRVGRQETMVGTGRGYTADAARRSRLSRAPMLPVAVRVERGKENDLLADALAQLGCQVSRKAGLGRPTFAMDRGGFRLLCWDEEGREVPGDRLWVLLTRIEMENGGKRAALPAWAPAAAEEVARSLGGKLLRLGRDGAEARRLWGELPWMWDALFAACRICARMGLTGESLGALDRSCPAFATARTEVPISSGRGRVMGELEGNQKDHGQGEGLRVRVGEGWVYVVPVSSRRALRVIAESVSTEAAQELCGSYAEKIRQMDEVGKQ